MRVLVTGDREWTDGSMIGRALLEVELEFSTLGQPMVLIEGKARGADSLAWFNLPAGWQSERYPADWQRYGRAAGPVRNKQMLDSGVDLCLAFHDQLDLSRGTKDMVQRCLARGVEVRHFAHNQPMQVLRHV